MKAEWKRFDKEQPVEAKKYIVFNALNGEMSTSNFYPGNKLFDSVACFSIFNRSCKSKANQIFWTEMPDPPTGVSAERIRVLTEKLNRATATAEKLRKKIEELSQ